MKTLIKVYRVSDENKGLVLIITELKCKESAMKTLIKIYYRVSDENKN